MGRHVTKFLPYAAVALVVAVVAGVGLRLLERRIAVRPGLAGCARLASETRRIDCYGHELTGRVARARRDAGADRDARDRAVDRELAAIERRASRDVALRGVCHQAMHVVGRHDGRLPAVMAPDERGAADGGATDGGSADGVMARLHFPEHASRECTAGYTHGLAEGYLMAEGSSRVRDLAAIYRGVCQQPDAADGCAHGLGHAVLRRDGSVSRSVDACGALPDGRGTDCANGVYMERAMRRPVISPARFAALCERQGGVELQRACAFYVALSATLAGRDEAGVVSACAALDGVALRRECVEAFGRNLGSNGVALCRLVEPALARSCIEGALGLDLASGHVSRSGALEQCRSLSAQLRTLCRAIVRAE